jgi:bifunctional non-homologous end joining protein LigD
MPFLSLTRLGLDPIGPDPFPRQLRPMLATLERQPFNDLEWVYEPKWDGFRTIALIREKSATLFSRNLRPFTKIFRPIADDLKDFPLSLVLDEEVVALDNKGVPDFEALQERLRPGERPRSGRLAYIVFDCLFVNGHSLLRRPLEYRREVLQSLKQILEGPRIRVPAPLEGLDGRIIFRESVRLGLEGVVAKRRGSIYRPGLRSAGWVKIPARSREEFLISGYFAAGHNRLSSLVLGERDSHGRLRYVGLVATGLSDTLRADLLGELRKLARKRCPFGRVPEMREPFGGPRSGLSPHWTAPRIIVEVEFKKRTPDGLRHATLKGVRPDRNPSR